MPLALSAPVAAVAARVMSLEMRPRLYGVLLASSGALLIASAMSGSRDHTASEGNRA